MNETKQRKFTRWSAAETAAVTGYFKHYIYNSDGSGPALPGKAELLKFKNHSPIPYEWTTIRNKIVNEKLAAAKRKKLRLENLKC